MTSSVATRVLHTFRGHETATEHAVRRADWSIEDKATTLMRLWSHPETAVRARYLAATVSALAAEHPWVWRGFWSSVFGSLALIDVQSAFGGRYTLALSVVMLLAACVSAAAGTRIFVFLNGCDAPQLAAVAREAAGPCAFEGTTQWEALASRVREYVELREHDQHEGPSEPLRLHMRRCAIELRRHHHGSRAAAVALEGGEAELSVVPALRAELALRDFSGHLDRADETLIALRAVALTARVNREMAPLALPDPVPRRCCR